MNFGTKGCMYNCGDECTGECIKVETKTKMSNVLTERERSIIFHSKNYDYRMNKWTPEEQHDKAGIPRLRSELTDNDKTFLQINQTKDDNNI
tara:strand:+ start:222 stop:497 length:276 start_codon:yes stop_codon:yes gene_type:complete